MDTANSYIVLASACVIALIHLSIFLVTSLCFFHIANRLSMGKIMLLMNATNWASFGITMLVVPYTLFFSYVEYFLGIL